MPELPDVLVYIDALKRQIGGQRIEGVDLRSPFLVRSVEPLAQAEGKTDRLGAGRGSLPRLPPHDHGTVPLEKGGCQAAGQDRSRRLSFR